MDTKLSLAKIEHSVLRWFDAPSRNKFIKNLSYGLLNHECDVVIVSKSKYLTEIEIKRSFSDFLADFKKKHHHDDDCRIKNFYYCLPESIVDKAMAVLREKVESKVSGNIILIKSSKIIDRLRVLNPNVEEIIECILKKVGVQSQNVYVMLENASISSIASHNLRYTNSIFVIDIGKNRKNRKFVRTYSMPGYFAEKENEIYIRYGTLFNLCGECLTAKRIISCSIGNDIKILLKTVKVVLRGEGSM